MMGHGQRKEDAYLDIILLLSPAPQLIMTLCR